MKDDWERLGKGRCEHVSSLAVLLGECLASKTRDNSGCEKLVLVLDGIDKQREAPHTLLSALARLGEVVSWKASNQPAFGKRGNRRRRRISTNQLGLARYRLYAWF